MTMSVCLRGCCLGPPPPASIPLCKLLSTNYGALSLPLESFLLLRQTLHKAPARLHIHSVTDRERQTTPQVCFTPQDTSANGTLLIEGFVLLLLSHRGLPKTSRGVHNQGRTVRHLRASQTMLFLYSLGIDAHSRKGQGQAWNQGP